MKTKVRNCKELAKAVNSNKDTIVIEGQFGSAVVKITASGNVVYLVAAGFIATVITGAVLMTKDSDSSEFPTDITFKCISAPPLIAAFGSEEVIKTAIAIAAAGGGIGVLHSLRKYDVEQKGHTVVLKRRK